MKDGAHSHGGGSAIVAIAAVFAVAIVAPVLLAVVHVLLVVLELVIIGVLSALGLVGATTAVLIFRHGWPTRTQIGGGTHGNRSYRAIDSVAYRWRREETPAIGQSDPQASWDDYRRTQKEDRRLQARTQDPRSRRTRPRDR
jgi:hypothetical protein